ncbi:hypothetical protein SIID45300_02430 [Candidatus Magnetaquicoccaceae bacterium FCR-1]|uniref:RepB-like DNA primase domain-containing protein n=1 Tax=Candidatus Magnetaquiglobus chichijimensis TaxID=3141448 RepID=A0ABQ0CB42_9PROT
MDAITQQRSRLAGISDGSHYGREKLSPTSTTQLQPILDESGNNALTHSSVWSNETDKTNKTDSVSNTQFLAALFGNTKSDHCPILVSFPGHPGEVPGGAWMGHPWKENSPELPEANNNYFSLAVFRPDEAGIYRRQKARFMALHAVMLDDIGSKVPREHLTLPPSWLLETSKGNFQAGFILKEPITDGTAADRLMNAIVTAGLCDPGANGPRARLARLPVAVNGKHEPPFPCRMETWNPDLRYAVKELADGLQLDMTTTASKRRARSPDNHDRHAERDPVWLPRPDENAVLAGLRDRGLYKGPLGDGKHDITCPWVEEHTDNLDGGTAYFEPDDNWPIGGFKCLHGHCAHRHMHALLKFLGVDAHAARMKSIIRVVPGALDRIVDAAERELVQTRRHYQRGGLIVTVVTDPGTRETRVQEISQPALVRALAGVATWERYDARSQAWVRTDPPERPVNVLFNSEEYPHLSVLKGLTRQPYLRPDGSLMYRAGYDEATGMFGVFNERAFAIPDHPTRDEADAAAKLLMGLLSEFHFANAHAQAAALSAILTAVVRPSLPLAPMFHVKAHVLGSGKSYLCELITAFATPQRGTPTTFPADDEECRKLLLAELLRAPAVIEFDNLTSDLLPHKSLCTALTSEFMTGRILGVSKTATVNTRALFLSSGNNVGPVRDMTRRCITISLDPGCETPAARSFERPDLVREVLAERWRYVSAALTIVRAWIEAGRPKIECKSLVSYDDWSDLCRQSLMWLGFADPTNAIFESMADDPDREILGRILLALNAEFGNAPTMVRDIVKRSEHSVDDMSSEGELREVLHDIAFERGGINRRRLGWWIKRHEGQIVNSLKFVRASGNRSAEAWKVESV